MKTDRIMAHIVVGLLGLAYLALGVGILICGLR